MADLVCLACARKRRGLNRFRNHAGQWTQWWPLRWVHATWCARRYL